MGKSKKTKPSPRARKSKARALPAKSTVVNLLADDLTVGSPEIGRPGLGQRDADPKRR
jgi:hypothetical protein